jgi:hypothetical protein
MAGRSRSHSEERWQLLPQTVIRCNAARPNGSRCKREAEAGAVVCDQHGGAAAQVRRRAGERLVMTADQAAQMLVKMMEDTEVPFGVRAKIAQDLLDRAGLIAAQVHQIIPTRKTRSCGSSRVSSATRATGSPTHRQIRRQRLRATPPAAVISTTSSRRKSRSGDRRARR